VPGHDPHGLEHFLIANTVMTTEPFNHALARNSELGGQSSLS